MGIFDFIKKLFGSPAISQLSRSRSDYLQSSPPSTQSFRTLPSRPIPPLAGRRVESGPLQELLELIQGKGRPEYPFLTREYSPSSRVPCVDFTPFIIERLAAGDVRSISQLMREIIAANPGLGTKGEWIEEEVEKVLCAPLEKYFHFADPDAYRQLRAMWIIVIRKGGGGGVWLDDDQRFNPRLYLAQAFSSYEIEMHPEIEDLRIKGNKYIRKMRKEWFDVPVIKASELTIPPLPTGKCLDQVRGLSIGARLHLFFAVEAGGGRLPHLAGFVPRDMGLYPQDSSREILESGLLIPCKAHNILKKSFEKSELLETCEQGGVTFMKSWNKDKLIQAVLSAPPKYIDQFISDSGLAVVNPDHADCLLALLTRARELEPVFKVLCFI